MDFRDFANNYKPKEKATTNTDNKSNNTSSQGQYEDMIKQYENLSQDELMSELFKQSAEMKSQGKWNNAEMEKIANTLTPYLNNQQRQMLANLTQQLNKD